MNNKHVWADPDAAKAAVKEAQERQNRVANQDSRVRSVTWRLWMLGQRNHFQDSIRSMFGVHR